MNQNIRREVEIPSALDQRILRAATVKARSIRIRHLWLHRAAPLAAAACAVIVGAIFLLSGNSEPKAKLPSSELLAMSDWTKIEQETYNLSFELYSKSEALKEYASAKREGKYL